MIEAQTIVIERTCEDSCPTSVYTGQVCFENDTNSVIRRYVYYILLWVTYSVFEKRKDFSDNIVWSEYMKKKKNG